MEQLHKHAANYVPLSPITFIERAAAVYPTRFSVIYRGTRFTWAETYERCLRFASSLRSLSVGKNDVVSVLAPNVPALYEMHFAVPMAGAVLNTINTRLDASNIATILRHSEAKAFLVDYQYVKLARDALKRLIAQDANSSSPPLVVVIDDVDSPTGVRLGELEYESLVRRGDSRYVPVVLDDECDAIALNYTSGTTSAPKGVVYSHRGAYLSCLSLLLQWEVRSEPVYLWSLPMFHCNGWTFTWGMAARGGTNVCIRSPSAAEIYQAIADHRVTHMCCAPILFNVIIGADAAERRPISSPVQLLTGGAPPPAALLEKMEEIGFHVTHAYGLTEATGPALVCEWQAAWNRLRAVDQAQLKSRQGISVLSLADVDVVDTDTMDRVPRDGRSVGEILLRGSSIMKGYFKDPKATADAFKDGWFHTGDAGVVHSDGYVEVKDRIKDVIISGGENISSVEVEAVLYSHPLVMEAAVVAKPHQHWGETPCAFIQLKKEKTEEKIQVKEEDIISYCRERMAHFMVPKAVVFLEELPKVNMKVQKFKLREMAKRVPTVEKYPRKTINTQQRSNRNNHRFRQNEPEVIARPRL